MAHESQPPHALGGLHHAWHPRYDPDLSQAVLQRMGLRSSMGRIGNAYDNARSERVTAPSRASTASRGRSHRKPWLGLPWNRP